jgi:Predicted UDP-glucose 6-dehydrogenase
MLFWRNGCLLLTLCQKYDEKTGADVKEVSNAIGMDSRIGPKFLNASVGFGGSCFQKDILNLVYISKTYGLNEVADYWEQVILMNEHQKNRFSDNIVKTMYNTVSGKNIAFLGWAFKKDTNDTRESPAIKVADNLLNEQALISVYDPKVVKEKVYTDLDYLNTRASEENRSLVSVKKDPYDACKGVHAVAILTEWDQFKQLDWVKIYNNMQKPAFLFDGRGLLNKEDMDAIGFVFYKIGSGN